MRRLSREFNLPGSCRERLYTFLTGAKPRSIARSSVYQMARKVEIFQIEATTVANIKVSKLGGRKPLPDRKRGFNASGHAR